MTDAPAALPAPTNAKPSLWPPVLTAILLSACLHGPTIWQIPISQTEGHRAVPAMAMVDTGDWLVPHLYGRVYLRKPPLHFWMVASSDAVFGRHEAAWRLPAVVFSALMAGVCTLFAARYFGRSAAWFTAFFVVALIPLWGEARSADIDGTNTFFSIACALLMLRMLTTSSGLLTVLLCALAFGCTLLSKGPQGLTIIGGALLWGACVAVLQRKPQRLLGLLVVLVGGTGLFAAWAYGVYLQGVSDYSGVAEARGNMKPDSGARLLKALATGPTLFAFALPFSLALPLAFLRALRGADAEQQRMTTALIGAVLLSWCICIASGMANPRYGYVTLPPIAIIAGVAASRMWALSDDSRRRLLQFGVGTGLLFAGVSAGLAVMLYGQMPVVVVTIAGVSVTLGLLTLVVAILKARPAFIALLLCGNLACVGALFTFHNWNERMQRSAYPAAIMLKEQLPPDAVIVTGQAARYRSDLFYYCDRPVRAYGEHIPDPRQLPAGVWLVMHDDEWQAWKEIVAPRFERLQEFKAGGATPLYVGRWVGTEDAPAELPDALQTTPGPQ